ncbi:antitermination protein, partial [Escherichia coli]
MITRPELVARLYSPLKFIRRFHMTRRTQFKGTSRSRRRERLKAKA